MLGSADVFQVRLHLHVPGAALLQRFEAGTLHSHCPQTRFYRPDLGGDHQHVRQCGNI